MKTMNQMMSQLFLVAAMLLTLGQNAKAQNAEITYIERSWDSENKKVVDTATPISDYTVIEGDHANDWYQLGVDDGNDHYYVVKGEAIYQTLNTFGRAHLILCDGASLTITGGIKVENNAKIFIYGQKNDTGRLSVTNSYEDAAGIGSAKGVSCGDITIHGGEVSAIGYDGAGIGGGEDRSAGNITIYGGKVYGSGDEGNGAGIGGGYAGSGGNITIYGGEVTAQGGKRAAGIGGGEKYCGGGAMGDITIWGGTVMALGGSQGAGIGGGMDCKDNYGTLTINGGTVKAAGGYIAAGIGGGYQGNGCTVVINDGVVTARGNHYYTDTYICSAAIGGGFEGEGGNVTINGGKVKCENVVCSSYGCVGQYIGRGFNGGDKGYLFLSDSVRVFDAHTDLNTWVDVDMRYECASGRSGEDNYILIEVCPHEGFEYVDETHQRIVCSHCKMGGQVVEKTTKTVNAKKSNKFVSDPQGINKFDTQTSDNEPIYDLGGRKYDSSMLTNGQLPKGIYIRGGKKFVVK